MAKQGYIPDFGVVADYVDIGDGTTNLSNDGENAWMVGINVTVPVWFWKINSDIKSESQRLEAEKNTYQDKKTF